MIRRKYQEKFFVPAISWTCPIVTWEAPFGRNEKKKGKGLKVGEAIPVFPEGFTGVLYIH